MNLFKLENWCSRAVRRIHYPPDRNDVYNELYQHMQDRCESFTARGIPEEEAKDLTVRAMGDPDELAPMLAEIHNSIWPYLVIITRWVTAAVLAVTLFTLIGYIADEVRYTDSMDNHLYTQDYKGALTFYAEPKVSAELDGYTVTVTKVAKRYDENSWPNVLFFRLEISNGYRGSEMPDPKMWQWFWVEDSLGNRYDSYYRFDSHYLASLQKKDTHFRYVVDMSLERCISEDAQWLDLHYDRDGRNMILRIDLTEGVTQ